MEFNLLKYSEKQCLKIYSEEFWMFYSYSNNNEFVNISQILSSIQ